MEINPDLTSSVDVVQVIIDKGVKKIKKILTKLLSLTIILGLVFMAIPDIMVPSASEGSGEVVHKTLDGTKEIVPLVGGPDDTHWEVLNPDGYPGGQGYTPAAQQLSAFQKEYFSFQNENNELMVVYTNDAIGNYGSQNYFGIIEFIYNCADKNIYLDFNKDTLRIDVNSTLQSDKDVKHPYFAVMYFEGIPDPFFVSILDSYTTGFISGRYTTEVNLNDFINQSWAVDWKNRADAAGGKLKLNRISFLSDLNYRSTPGSCFYIYDFYLMKSIPPVMVPIGPDDDVGAMWETQIESVIYGGIDDTGNQPYVNTHIDENGYLTAACSHVAPSAGTIRVPNRYFQGEELSLNENIMFHYDFTARASNWRMYLLFYEKGYYGRPFGIYLTKEICEKAGISIELGGNGVSGTYQGSISIRDVVDEYGCESLLNPGQALSTIQFCSFEIQIIPDDVKNHVLQFRHLSFDYGQKTFPPAPAPESIAIPQSNLVLPEMEEYDLCPSASSGGWRVSTKSDRGTYVPLPANEAIASITDMADGSVRISPTQYALQENGYFGDIAVQYELDEPFELNIGTDWLRFDIECSDAWLVVLNGESNGKTTSFLATSLTNYAWDWCRESTINNVYPYFQFAHLCEMWMEDFGALHEPILITNITFMMSLEWSSSTNSYIKIRDLTHLKPKNDVQTVEDRISALVGRVITPTDYDEVKQTKEMYDKLDTGSKASISNELRRVLQKAAAVAYSINYEKVRLTGMEDGNWEVMRPLSGPGSDYPDSFIPNSQQQSVFGDTYIGFQEMWTDVLQALYLPAARGKYGPNEGWFGDIKFKYNHKNNPIPINFYKDKIRMNVESSISLDITYPFKIDLYFEGYSEALPIQVLGANYNKFVRPTAEIADIDTQHLGNGRVYIEYDLKEFLESDSHTPDADWISRIKEHGGVLKLREIVFRQEISWYGDESIHMKFVDFSLLKPDETPPQPGAVSAQVENADITVSWDSAVDNANGELNYELFFSPTVITEQNIRTMSPVRSYAGYTTGQTLLDGLMGNTTYYLALRVTDYCGNSSIVILDPVTTKEAVLKNQLSMIGAQVLLPQTPSEPYKIRFGTEIYCTKVGNDLQLTYASQDYTILDYGTIFIISDQLNPGEELTVDIQNPKAIIVPSTTIYQQTDYPSGKRSIIYTVIIKNIPTSQVDRDISARAYVRCRNSSGQITYFYSQPIVRSVSDVLGLM